MIELKDTYAAMISENSDDRLWAEKWQLEIRLHKLRCFIVQVKNGKLSNLPMVPLEMLERQEKVMSNYLKILCQKAVMMGVHVWSEIPPSQIEKMMEGD